MHRIATLLAVLTTIAGSAGGAAAADKEDRVFELRVYYAAKGKLDALHARFRDHTCKLFEKHGMTLVGFWSPIDRGQSEEVMYYILAYPSKEAADQAWKAFRADPDWLQAKAASEKDGPLVSKVESGYLSPTDYSKLK